ncbi:hypothetical protein ANN_04315 [Periplaneta americana]|uniref:Per a allergen n=1 Tax=Periplaneta americana TaxID=6978 RepID=A0ABQ8T878_PERAM|nr:hypothetical protein ANN_04315 [Periplaneta americana]
MNLREVGYDGRDWIILALDLYPADCGLMKAEFDAEKRSLLKTGGRPASDINVEDDPELDSCGIDIKMYSFPGKG